jgi:hypothetical protein
VNIGSLSLNHSFSSNLMQMSAWSYRFLTSWKSATLIFSPATVRHTHESFSDFSSFDRSSKKFWCVYTKFSPEMNYVLCRIVHRFPNSCAKTSNTNFDNRYNIKRSENCFSVYFVLNRKIAKNRKILAFHYFNSILLQSVSLI